MARNGVSKTACKIMLPNDLLKEIDEAVIDGHYGGRTDLIIFAVRSLLTMRRMVTTVNRAFVVFNSATHAGREMEKYLNRK